MEISGPEWDLSKEYPSFESPEFLSDFDEIQKLTIQLSALAAKASEPDSLKAAILLQEKIAAVLGSLSTYANCQTSVDGKDAVAAKWFGKIQALSSSVHAASTPVYNTLRLASEDAISGLLSEPELASHAFHIRHVRKLRDQTLSTPEESLIAQLSTDGHKAWSTLYDQLNSGIECEILTPTGSRKVGFPKAFSLLSHQEPDVRKNAYEAIQAAWKPHAPTCASILNAITGWKLQLCERRSQAAGRKVQFLEGALHGGRLSAETLATMIKVAEDRRDVGQRALKLIASKLGKDRLDPWDLSAPMPATSAPEGTSFDKALELVRTGLAKVEPSIGDFVSMMAKNRWIEGRVLDGKRSGAFCCGFPKSRSPRVFMSYTGIPANVGTLAHELGHAFHNWTLKDLPLIAASYPLTLGETASISFETFVTNELVARSSPAEAAELLWSDALDMGVFLLNIPARYELDRQIHERRQDGPLSAEELSRMTVECWEKWHGDAVSSHDPLFWAHKRHFYFTYASFYNFPYLFGYLFSMGVLAQRDRLGKGFFPAYVALLRDSGTMTVEELAQKHLGADLTKPDFWISSIAIVERRLEQVERALG